MDVMAVANTPIGNMLRRGTLRRKEIFTHPARNFCGKGCLYSQTPADAGKETRTSMKNLKRSALLAALGAALTLPAAFAQTENAPSGATGQGEHKHGDRMARHQQMEDQMAKELNLTDAQRAELKTFHEQQKAKMDAIRDNDQLTREEKRAQMKSLMEERKAKMNSVLTAEQKTKWKELRKEHRGMHGKRGGAHGGPDDKGPSGAGASN